MDGINVLYAFQYTTNISPLVGYLKNKLKKELLENGFAIGLFDTVNNKGALEELLESGKYNVLVCAEQLGEEKISSGSLKAWSQKFPDVKVILGVGKDKKGGEKLVRLINNAPFYYNAVYESDLTGEVVASLIKTGRTKEEAIVYYGLEKRLGEEKEVPIEPAVVKEADKKEERTEGGKVGREKARKEEQEVGRGRTL